MTEERGETVRWREDIPPAPPDDAGAEPEIPDQPMGPAPDESPEDAPLPGLPEEEPPSGG